MVSLNIIMDVTDLFNIIKDGENYKTEFKSKIEKNAAKDAVALLNTNGGFIIFGVTDDGKIIGTQRKNPKKAVETLILQPINPVPKSKIYEFDINGKHLVVLELKKNGRIYSYKNVVYSRIGSLSKPLSLDELFSKASESLLIKFDSLICPNARMDDINTRLVDKYLKERERRRNIFYEKPNKEIFVKINAAARKNGKIMPTNAGILFFSDNPQKFIPHAKLRIDFVKDELLLEAEKKYEISGSLWQIIDKGIEILRTETPLESYQMEVKRMERPKFPLSAIREALINALIHRNYFIPAEVIVLVFPDRIEIKNPGSFPPGVTPDHPKHIPRNPILAQYVYDIGYVEKYGIGIERMRKYCRENNYPEPKFLLEESYTTVIFETIPAKISAVRKELDEKEIAILDCLRGSALSSSQIAQIVGLSKVTVVRKLKRLIKLKLIKKKGSGPRIKYFLP